MVIGRGEVEVSTGLSLRAIRETSLHAFALGRFALVDMHQLKSGVPSRLAGLGYLQQRPPVGKLAFQQGGIDFDAFMGQHIGSLGEILQLGGVLIRDRLSIEPVVHRLSRYAEGGREV